MSDIRLAYITCETRQAALKLGQALVKERLAACVNVLGPMTSIYHWEGEVESADEVVLIAKTTSQNTSALTARVKALHDYDVPCILSLPVQGDEGNPDYLAWLKSEAERD